MCVSEWWNSSSLCSSFLSSPKTWERERGRAAIFAEWESVRERDCGYAVIVTTNSNWTVYWIYSGAIESFLEPKHKFNSKNTNTQQQQVIHTVTAHGTTHWHIMHNKSTQSSTEKCIMTRGFQTRQRVSYQIWEPNIGLLLHVKEGQAP